MALRGGGMCINQAVCSWCSICLHISWKCVCFSVIRCTFIPAYVNLQYNVPIQMWMCGTGSTFLSTAAVNESCESCLLIYSSICMFICECVCKRERDMCKHANRELRDQNKPAPVLSVLEACCSRCILEDFLSGSVSHLTTV